MQHQIENSVNNMWTAFLFMVGFITHRLSLEQTDMILSIMLKLFTMASVLMVIVINYLAFSYQVRGAWVRIKRFIWRRTRFLKK